MTKTNDVHLKAIFILILNTVEMFKLKQKDICNYQYETIRGEVIRATNCCNLQRNNVTLQVIEERCCTYYHISQTLSRNKIPSWQVKAACCSKLNFFNLQQPNSVAWECLRWVVIRATTLIICISIKTKYRSQERFHKSQFLWEVSVSIVKIFETLSTV